MGNIPISINGRQRNIIYTLLRLEGSTTLNALAELTHLSPRIIRYNLDVVRAWFRNEGVELTCRPGYGIDLKLGKQTRRQLLALICGIDDHDLILTSEQRRRLILLDLLTSRSPIPSHHLAVIEAISRSTIFHDIQAMQKWLGDFHIRLERRTHKGFWIEGKETARRFALSQLIRDEMGKNTWYKSWDLAESGLLRDGSISLKFTEFIQQLPLSFTRRIVEHIESGMGRDLAVRSRIEMQLYLALTILALKEGRHAEGYDDISLRQTLEYEVAQIAAHEIAQKWQLMLAESEIETITAMLLGSRWADASDISANGKKPARQPRSEAIRLARLMSSVCSSQLHPLLKIDQELIEGLAAHLDSVIYRLRFNLPIRNSQLEAIKKTYPEVYRSAEKGVVLLEKELGMPIPPNETGFLAMYLAAALERLRTARGIRRSVIVINDGVRAPTALLKARLEFEFPSLDVVAVYNNFDWDSQDFPRAELILSLIPIEKQLIPTIQITSFLDRNDIEQIQQWLFNKEVLERRAGISKAENPSLVDLLDLPDILWDVEHVADWRQAVILSSQPLTRSDKIEPRYIEAMIEIIEEYGPYMILAPGVILLHAKPTDGVNTLCLGLMKLSQGVNFGAPELDPMDLIFVLGAVDNQAHLNALFQLNALIEMPAFLGDLRRASSPSDALRTIWRYLPAITID